MRWLVFFTFSLRLCARSFDDVTPSSSEEILSLTTDLLIDGYVAVTSGQICISEDDLRIKGAQDLVLKRTYVAPRILGRYDDKDKVDRLILAKELHQLETKGWIVYSHLWAGYNRNSKYFQVCDPQGFVLEFQIENQRGILKTASYGCSNLRGEKPTSTADIRNIELLMEGDELKITWPDGLERHYLKSYAGGYFLQKEVLPNTKTIRYEYDSGGLCKVVSSDPSGNLTYASITRVQDHYIGSDGQTASLVYEKKEVKGEFKKKGHKEKVTFHFPVMTKASNSSYINNLSYNERTLLNWYDAKNYPISCTYFQNKNVPACVQTFSNPSGCYSFSYDRAIPDKKGGSTTVTHPDGAQTVYRFNKILLLEAIENWLNNQLINKKTFEYDHKQHIKSIETLDGEGQLLIAKRFECDDKGNATLEKTEGDCGCFNVKRKFDKNRLVFEQYDNGLEYAFTYLGDTRLITSKTTFESGVQLRKTLYFYDEANNLVQIEEEGKTKTSYKLYQTGPYVHRVEWEEKKDNEGIVLYKIHYGYDQWGNTSQEQHFGSDGSLAYTIWRVYNEKGELLSETNPVQETAVYKYDARGRCFYEKPFSNGLVIGRIFDDKGRLTLLQEDDHETRFEYNASDELIKKVDYLGFTTTYHYHPVHGKPDRIDEESSVTEISYDFFGRPVATLDAMNAKTIKNYNSYGDVFQITHPEGGQEFFTYYPNGLLKSHIDPDGLTTNYRYDALSRITEKTVGLQTTFFEYDGYNLVKINDPAGYVTTYQYDFADRRIEENREGRITRYGYDSLGFLSQEEKGEHRTEYTNDPLGRILTKSIDSVLETSWGYDQGGNIVSIEQGGTRRLMYDSHNRCIETIDEENNKTLISYQKGPKVLIKTVTDPMKIKTIYIYNSKNQLLSKAVDGRIVENFEYDSLFRLQKQDHICFQYTPNGNKQKIQESDTRTTYWTYTPGNLKLSKQKPDGTVILYRYNQQCLPEKIGSRAFRYDQLNRVIGGTGFSRILDPFGNILKEEWSNGLWIETDYDELDRPIIRKLPDCSQIQYKYSGPFLKAVTRVSSTGKELYSHSYDDYDPKGNPKVEQGLFKISYAYDRNGRRVGQENPYYVESIGYNPAGNIVKKGNTTYTYDHLSQMTSESGKFTAAYDVHYNLKKLNNQVINIDPLGQVKGLQYDLNGNCLKTGFIYDEFDQLIEAGGERFIYDALGRRIQKGQTAFLYIGDEEIGAFEQGKAKELKIVGIKAPIAIEIKQIPYAPIVDVQGVIRSLVDWRTKQIFKQNNCDVFGAGLSDEIPYAYAGKRYDSKTGLVYFGKRYYDPSFRRWLTPDPIGSIDHSNLYQYVFNNPFRYQDPNGESASGFWRGFGECCLGFVIVISSLGIEASTGGAFTLFLGATASLGLTLMKDGASTMQSNAKDEKLSHGSQKNTELYAPALKEEVRKTPRFNGINLGSNGSKYLEEGGQSRGQGFLEKGKGHQEDLYDYLYKPNSTEGAFGRGYPKSLDNWSY